MTTLPGIPADPATKTRRRILLIEDRDDDADMLSHELRRGGILFDVTRVETAEQLRMQLAAQSWDIILSDANLPTFSARAALGVLRETKIDVPFIVVSGVMRTIDAIALIKAGANDFVQKEDMARLIPTVERELREAEARQRHRHTEEQLSRLGRILDASSNEIYVFHHETENFIQVNQGARTNLGYSDDELYKLTPNDILHDISPQRWESHLDALREGNEKDYETIEGWHRRKDGSTYPVELRLQYAPTEQPPVFVAIALDISERKAYEQKLLRQANYDDLTGLPNRVLALDRLNQTLAETQRTDHQVALMFIDLDGFKNVNDTLGHEIGDLLLQEAAHRLNDCVRHGQTVARFGGDEFLVIQPGVTTPADAEPIARRILSAFNRPFNAHNQEIVLTTSIGITLFPDDGNTVTELLRNADTAMYRAKENGRNNYRFFTQEMNQRATKRLEMESHLRSAIDRGELSIWYQPVTDVKTNQLIAGEALMRWNCPALGSISPTQFIPLAEETGLIIPIGEWLLYQACTQAKRWHDAGHRLRLNINISSRQFRGNDLLDTVTAALKVSKLAPEYLELEITEGLLIDDAPDALTVLQAFTEMGIRIAIDDFGTGYSSLSYLKRYPFSTLKIDGSFIRSLQTDADDAALTSAVIAMAHNMGLKVVGEGVETIEQLDFLYSEGCDMIQGYLVSKPLPPDEFAQFIDILR